MHDSHTTDVLMDVVNRLTTLVQQLSEMAKRLDQVEIATTGIDASEDGCLSEAMQVRKERLRLIEAWSQLEVEQRKFALQMTGSVSKENITTHATAMPTISVTPISPDSRAQFAFLQYECDRHREHNSS